MTGSRILLKRFSRIRIRIRNQNQNQPNQNERNQELLESCTESNDLAESERAESGIRTSRIKNQNQSWEEFIDSAKSQPPQTQPPTQFIAGINQNQAGTNLFQAGVHQKVWGNYVYKLNE